MLPGPAIALFFTRPSANLVIVRPAGDGPGLHRIEHIKLPFGLRLPYWQKCQWAQICDENRKCGFLVDFAEPRHHAGVNKCPDGVRMIRSATIEDASRISEIYNHYVLHSTITFEEQPVPADEMRERIAEVLDGLPWLVWVENHVVQGFAFAHKWKTRSAYRYAAESTVYLAEGSTGKGIGSKLYQALLPELRRRRFHTVIGGIALPNGASVALHEKLGFEKVSHFREVGRKFDNWIDVGYWQLVL